MRGLGWASGEASQRNGEIVCKQGCAKAGSLHTACGLPQLRLEICPEILFSRIVNIDLETFEYPLWQLFDYSFTINIIICVGREKVLIS